MYANERTKIILDFDKLIKELHPATPFGIKLKNEQSPYLRTDKHLLSLELDRIEKLVELSQKQKPVFMEIKTSFKQIKDIRRSITRCSEGGVLNSVELFELKNLNFIFESLVKSQMQLHWDIPKKYRLKSLTWLKKLLDPENSGIKTFYIYDCYSDYLKSVRSKKTILEQRINRMKRYEVSSLEKELNIPIRVYGDLVINKKNKELLDKISEIPRLQSTGETYVNSLFKIRFSDEILEVQSEFEELKSQELLEECKVVERLSNDISKNAEEIVRNIEAIGEFDFAIAKGYMAIAHKAVKPKLINNGSCIIREGRHPLVEANLRKKSKEYKPISIDISSSVTLITGANMGGKTVSLKMMGLLCMMVQYGFLVPAKEMETDLFDFIFMSAGDEQSTDKGLSTFGAEMKGIKDMLNLADKRGLILIDELARGTNPNEGYAISYAIIEYLMKCKCLTIITTHFDGLVREGLKHLQVKGLRNIDEGMINTPERIEQHMDYTLIEIRGIQEVPKDAIKISKIMGLPDEIVKNAEKIINTK